MFSSLVILFPEQHIILKLQQSPLAEKHANGQTLVMANILQHLKEEKLMLQSKIFYVFKIYTNAVRHKSYSTAKKHSHLILKQQHAQETLSFQVIEDLQSSNFVFHHTASNCFSILD